MNETIYNERKNNGLCPVCGMPANDGYVTCKSCRSIRQKKKEAKKLLRLCVNCNAPTKRGTNLCEECSKKASDTKRKKREERKKEGLCTRCGKPTDGMHTDCDDCRNYAKEARNAYIKYGICSRCHKEKIYGNEKTCPECRSNRMGANAKYRAAHKEEINAKERLRYKRVYQERKDAGICTRCGKNKATNGKFSCSQCREKDNQKRRLAYEKILVDRPNRCRYCNNDSAPGYKVCEEHRQKLSASATSKKVNEARKKTRARLNW